MHDKTSFSLIVPGDSANKNRRDEQCNKISTASQLVIPVIAFLDPETVLENKNLL